MGDVLSLRKIEIAVLAAIAALALGFTMFGAQAAYADEGQLQAGSLLTVQNNAPGVTSEQGSGTAKANYTTATDGSNAVTYKASEASGKSAKVPNTITINGVSYKVTTIAANAFKGTTATKVTVGTNVNTIKAKAFKGSKVKTLVLNTKKLTKKGVKGALKGSKVTTVKVPKAKVKAYKKIFTKANCGKKVTVKKK